MLRKALARFTGLRQPSSSPPRTRSWVPWIAGAIAVVLSFLITLWLIGPTRPLGPGEKSMTQTLP